MKNQRLPKLFYNKFFWQLTLALFMLGMAIFFIRHEHVEVYQIKEQLKELNPFYLFIGIILTFLYILLQGMMYVYSFRALDSSVGLSACIHLFLRRNLVSIFLPAGGFSSLGFFTKNIESEKVSRSKIYLASTLYGFFGIFSVIIIAIPILFYAFLNNQLRSAEIYGFLALLVLTGTLIALAVSAFRKGLVYSMIGNRFPKLGIFINDIIAHDIKTTDAIKALSASVCIEMVGIAHLYISMLALGYAPSLAAAMIGYVVMVVLLVISPFLRGLGAIEVSLTFILGQYHYPVTAAATTTLLFRFFEFWLPLFIGIGSFVSRKDNLLLRVLPALLLFILGLTNIISAITPAIPTRLQWLETVLPNELIFTSNGIILLSGLILIILAVFLLQGARRAWYFAVFLTATSIIGHLTKAADFEESILSAVVIIVLIYTRRSYILKPHPKFTRISLKVIFYGFGAVLLYGVLGFYFMDKRHFGITFVFSDAIKEVVSLFLFLDTPGTEPVTRFGQHFIYSLYGAGILYLVFVIIGLVRPYFTKPFNTEEERRLVISLARKYGSSAMDFFKVYPDKLFFISSNRQSFISFRVTRHIAVVLENPVAADKMEMTRAIEEFDKYCAQNGFVPVYYRVPEDDLPIYRAMKKKNFPVGEEAVLDLTNFRMEGRKMKITRSAVNRLTTQGYTFHAYPPPIKEGVMQKFEQVSDKWLADLGRKEIAFTQGIFDREILKNQTIMTIENSEERIVAFLNQVPVFFPSMATYDLIRKLPDAPNGVLDMLLCQTFLYLQARGYKKINLGLAPLSGLTGIDLKEKTVKYAYENIRRFGHFKGLRKYKEKFHPDWQRTYLVYDHHYHLLQIPAALRKVSAPGS